MDKYVNYLIIAEATAFTTLLINFFIGWQFALAFPLIAITAYYEIYEIFRSK